MNRTTFLPLLLFFLGACAAVPVQTIPQSTATVQLLSIVPSAGSMVNENTTLSAELQYTIENFDPAAQYHVSPQFDSTQGPGQTFNLSDGPASASRLRTAAGRVRFHHPLRGEWSHRWLAKPVRVTFFITVRTGPQRSKVIGKSETVQFGEAQRD